MTSPQFETQVVVIGAGVSGCTAALALRQAGVEVALLERATGRPQRFCGEFVSGEALGFLDQLGMRETVEGLGPTWIRRLQLHGRGGSPYELPLAREGIGISRRALDAALLDAAARRGACVLEGTVVTGISGNLASGFDVRAKNNNRPEAHVIRCRAVVGAYGKRSSVDRLLRGRFLARHSGFVGVKCHYEQGETDSNVELYLFPGGYGGVVGIEDRRANLCFLARQSALRRAGGRPEALIQAAAGANPRLRAWLGPAKAVDGSLLTISQIPFGRKDQVVNGVFMIGDSAGVQAPFLGLGVAAGMHSAIACADIVSHWLVGRIDFAVAERQYRFWWRRHLGRTQRWGNLASGLLCRPGLGGLAIRLLNLFPAIGHRFYLDSRAGLRELPDGLG